MKVTNVERVKVVTLQFTEREVHLLRAALTDVEAHHEGAQLLLKSAGQSPAHDDDYTDLFGQLGEALR